MSFTYNGDLATALDYARFRLDDTLEDDPFLQDEIYAALFERFGTQLGLAMASRAIELKIAKRITSFGEAAGIRFSLDNQKWYRDQYDLIMQEPAYEAGDAGNLLRVGRIKRGHVDSYESYRRFHQYPEPLDPALESE